MNRDHLTMELVNAADLDHWYDDKIINLCCFANSHLRNSKIKTLSEWGHGQDGDVVRTHIGSDQAVYNQCAEQIYHLSRGWS